MNLYDINTNDIINWRIKIICREGYYFHSFPFHYDSPILSLLTVEIRDLDNILSKTVVEKILSRSYIFTTRKGSNYSLKTQEIIDL